MKKILFVIATIVTLSFASCGNNVCGSASQNDSDSIVTVDSADADTTIDSVAYDSASVCLD